VQGNEGSQPSHEGAPLGGRSGPRAGFWRRFGAYLIDSILLSILFYILSVVLGRPPLGNVHPGQTAPSGVGFLGLLITWAYFSYFEGSPSGQTIGKRALSIRIIDPQSDGSIGYGRGFLRQLGRIASGLVCLLGYLWMLWDKEKQTWHDKIASSVVVPADAYPVSKWPG
jgi:uncharacterized RDD family membrane protein YckC